MPYSNQGEHDTIGPTDCFNNNYQTAGRRRANEYQDILMNLSIVILAAGQGTRMHSDVPKVLHPLAGRPLLQHVIETAQMLTSDPIHVVYGHGGERVPKALGHLHARWVEQAEQLGTGHAVQQVIPALGDQGLVLVLYGDVPLISAETLNRLVSAAGDDRLALLTVKLDNPAGYGRIVRNASGEVVRIVEQKDASDEELAISEVNTGILSAPSAHLRRWLENLRDDNAQREYYLTDVIAMAVDGGLRVTTVAPHSALEVMGVNDRKQLSVLEREYQAHQAERLMHQGVTLLDPARFDLRGNLKIGKDVTIDINVVLEGNVELGNRVKIGPNVVLRNTRIGDDAEILANTVIEDAIVGAGSRVGPFARIRPDTELAQDVHIGNFVELKKAQVGRGSKINHLSYVGDTSVGKHVNIGAGTIVCNYDGANKHHTVIEDDAFIGSDTQLVAPVSVGKGATIGAGSTITRDVPAGELTLSRSKQTTIPGWQRPRKEPKD
jgi:bifunctional UDP-N-acetylglucosamine pyrophosphorylase/glucosamine-1-phosphate N-acetyltransferase